MSSNVKKKKGSPNPSKEKKQLAKTDNSINPEKMFENFFDRYKFFISKDGKNTYYIKDTISNQFYRKNSNDFPLFIRTITYDFARDNNVDLLDLRTFLLTKTDSRTTILTENALYKYISEKDNIISVESEKFKPVDELIIDNDGLQYFNTFVCPKYLKKSFNNKNKDKNSFPYIKSLLMNLCANDEDSYDYFLEVFSNTIVNPENLRQGYILFQGDPASGKGTFEDLILSKIFGRYFVASDSETVFGKFNAIVADKLWVVIEEKEKTKAKDSVFTASKLKLLTGSNKSTKELKNVDAVENDNYVNYAITTNELNPGLDLTSNDRRCTVLGHSKSLGGSTANAPYVRSKLNIEIPKELDDFVSYLKNLNFKFEKINDSLKNNARSRLVKLDYKNHERFIYERLLVDGLELAPNQIKTIKGSLYVKIDDIFDLFGEYCTELGMHKTSKEKFFSYFYSIVGVSAVRKTIDKKKVRVIELSKIKKFIDINKREVEEQ